jgi:uncharacterized SAM-binding protein YcdF (DUF218 family)
MLYTVIKSLLMPPGGLILLFLIGFLLARGVLARLFIFTGLAVLTLMSLSPVAERLIAPLEPYPPLRPSDLARIDAQAILILGGERAFGAAEYGGDSVGPKTLQRLRYGAFLHRRTGLPVYVTAGSSPPEDPPLGVLMAGVLESEFGIPVAGVEQVSRTTEENATRSAEMLAADGVGRVLLVTHAWHLPRAVAAFERAGVAVIPAPTAFLARVDQAEQDAGLRDWLPSASAFSVSYFALHEHLGRAWYQLKASGDSGPLPSAPAR